MPGSPTRLFATAIPGIGTLLVNELADMPLPRVSSTVEHDGRTGYADFEVSHNPRMGSAPLSVFLRAGDADGLVPR